MVKSAQLNCFQVEAVSSYMAVDGRNFLAVVTSANNIVVYDAVKGEQLFTGRIPEKDMAPVKLISFIGTGQEFEFAVVLEDCRFIYLVDSSDKLVKEWIRHEALSTIISVEMVDLPLSEAQVDIESEFAADGGCFFFCHKLIFNIFFTRLLIFNSEIVRAFTGSVLESLIRRLKSQAEQFRRTCFSAANQLFLSSNFFPFGSKSFADWMASLRLASENTRRKDAPYERDYFNLRKIIVVSTLKSIVYGKFLRYFMAFSSRSCLLAWFSVECELKGAVICFA